VYGDFDCLRANEARGTEDEFRSGLLVIVEVRIVPVRYHPAFPVANRAHINGYVAFGYPELVASADIRGNLRTMYNVFAGEAGNVRARSADVFAINGSHPLPLPGKGPSSDGTSGAAAEYHNIVLSRDNLAEALFCIGVYIGFRILETIYFGDGVAESALRATRSTSCLSK
jgi:hypothetical protein